MTKVHSGDTIQARALPHHAGTINAIARALGRLELVDEWAGADHDMPGTTQAEREATRWAAVQFLAELTKELAAPGANATHAPAVTTRRCSSRGCSELLAGPFKPLAETLSTDEALALEAWANDLPVMSNSRAARLADEAYHTPAYAQPGPMSDHELNAWLRPEEAAGI